MKKDVDLNRIGPYKIKVQSKTKTTTTKRAPVPNPANTYAPV